MTDDGCIIGICGGDPVTISGLQRRLSDDIEYNNGIEQWASEMKKTDADLIRRLKRKEYTLKDCFDRRKKSPLQQFNYCPECGKKIDWKAMRNAL